MIEITELKSTGENSENFHIDNNEKINCVCDVMEWYNKFPGYRNFLNFDQNSNWNRIVLKLDIADDAFTILKALSKYCHLVCNNSF